MQENYGQYSNLTDMADDVPVRDGPQFQIPRPSSRTSGGFDNPVPVDTSDEVSEFYGRRHARIPAGIDVDFQTLEVSEDPQPPSGAASRIFSSFSSLKNNIRSGKDNLRQLAREALPRIGNYRDMSKSSFRPTLDELHEQNVQEQVQLFPIIWQFKGYAFL